MRACLSHDALYYLRRIGLVDAATWRLAADRELHDAMVSDGAPRFRAAYYQWAVNSFAARCARAGTGRTVLVAP